MMTISRRNLRQINLNQWKDGKSRLYISATEVTDANELVNQYNNILHELIENHAPEPEEVGQLLAKHHGKFVCALLIGFIHALTSAK